MISARLRERSRAIRNCETDSRDRTGEYVWYPRVLAIPGTSARYNSRAFVNKSIAEKWRSRVVPGKIRPSAPSSALSSAPHYYSGRQESGRINLPGVPYQ